ncbi:transcription antitermination factor NusB [Vagococcus jeotgali]|uniref:transcription antitermination factor NusB n=1 Tax=Vagococcus jeotgali TaxID=3109030 RepID=UPI002DD9B666|nr:transcription antitermination factor NusB [Vagococcus sp. B2T-5]
MNYLIQKTRKSKVELTRHQLREVAFQAMFSMMYQDDVSMTDAMRYTLLLADNSLTEEEEIVIPLYVDAVVAGVSEKQEELDGVIEKHLRGWKINRIAKADLIILRLAIFEMLYLQDVPNKVSLNEALELAKTYTDEESKRFINGVLSSVMAEIDSNK